MGPIRSSASRSAAVLFLLAMVVVLSPDLPAAAEEDGFLIATIEPDCQDAEEGRMFTVENVNPYGLLWGVEVSAADADPPFQIPELSGDYEADEVRQYFLPASVHDQNDWWIFAEGAYHFTFSGAAGECPTFVDDDGNIFESAIEWLAAEGITQGCNPPDNDEFCPDEPVTRAQMATFLVRALGYTDDGGGGWFTDTAGSTFERAIDRLRTAGVTQGCNPPDNDQFCPDDLVTRGQMAAFLVRAFGFTDSGAGDYFTDDDDSVFEKAIDRLRTAGVTQGCNPPDNDHYCPGDLVTRGQMAAFIKRAVTG